MDQSATQLARTMVNKGRNVVTRTGTAPQVSRRQVTIIDVDPSTTSCSIQFGFSDKVVPGVKYSPSYTPAAGDQAWVTINGAESIGDAVVTDQHPAPSYRTWP
jgi:hypothetical protein